MKATTGSGSIYYTRGFELISRQESSAASYYIYDGGLSVRALTNEAGTVTDTLVFDAFGNETAKTGSTDNSYGFQGEEQDATGLYYLRARYMDPSTGTFTSMDTYGGSLSDPMSLHKYMFANSNPVAYCDPGGHEASLQGMVAAMAISGILSAVDSGILYSLQNKDSDIEKYGKSVYGWNVATAAMNGFLKGFILGFIGYALCSILLVRLVLSAVGLSIGIQRASAGLGELESSGGNANRGLYNFLTGLLLIGVSTYGLSKSGSEILSKFGKGGKLIHLEGDPNVEGNGDWGDINKEIDDWFGEKSGPVEFTPPKGATPKEIAQIKEYVNGCNRAAFNGQLSPTGRVSTKGLLRRQASHAAALERARALAAGTPYRGVVGHVPDTTWTGKPVPFEWADQSLTVNSSMGGQAPKYPIGYKPTYYVYAGG